MHQTVRNESSPVHIRKAAAPHFDFANLPQDVRAEVGAQTAAIRQLNGESLAGKIEIGRRLIAIHKAVGPSNFQPLVSLSFDWSKGTASNYQSVARVFGKLRPHRLACFDWSALVILSREKAPRSARAEALARARAGQNINKALAEEIVARHRDLPEPDFEGERLLSRLYQVLHDVDERHDRLTATLRRRVSQRLTASVHRLDVQPLVAEFARIRGDGEPGRVGRVFTKPTASQAGGPGKSEIYSGQGGDSCTYTYTTEPQFFQKNHTSLPGSAR